MSQGGPTFAGMPYQPRTDVAGSFHHVMNRGARRDLVFFDDADRRTFLALLVEAAERTSSEIHGYCLLGNHWHLIVRSDGLLSTTMQLALSRYVRRFNRRHGFDGPLFRSRFTSTEITTDAQFVATSRYVHRNALDTGASRLEDYRWSSYRHFVGNGQRRPPWLDTSWTLALFSNDRAHYRRFVEDSLDDERVVVMASHTVGASTEDILDVVIRAVARTAGIPAHDVAASTPGVRNPARLAVLILATELDIPTPSLTAGLGGRDDKTTRRLLTRGRRRLRADPSFAALVERARDQIPAPDIEARSAA